MNKPGSHHSFRLSRPGKIRGTSCLVAGGLWFVLCGFIACPLHDLWPFFLCSTIFFLIALLLPLPRWQRLLTIVFLILTLVSIYLSLTAPPWPPPHPARPEKKHLPPP